MYANPNLMEQLSNTYRARRTAESESLRLLRQSQTSPMRQPAWSHLALLLARALISMGERLERSAGPQPQPRIETC